MDNINSERKMLKILLIVFTLISNISILAYGDGIAIDGIIEEAEWNYWFTDDSEQPVVDIYWYNDTTNIYIGILTDYAVENEDVLEFAYRASRRDYWFEIISDGSSNYRSSGGDYEGWWKGLNTGLPPGVNAVASTTNGNRSYEISISLLSMEEKANNFPEDFVFWYMVQNGTPDGPDNYYPDSRSGWWFQMEIEEEEDELVLEFAIPELPFGTIMALISMLTAMVIFAKKTSFFQLRI